MKRKSIRLILAGLVLALWPGLAPAQPTSFPPGQLSYQGYLTDANGNALATNTPVNYTVAFRVYDSSTGGNLLWGEQQIVTVDRGYFTVMLGNGSSIGAPATGDMTSIFTGPTASDRYLGMTVAGLSGNEISPRLRLNTTPYAFLARNATALLNSDGTTLASASNGVLTVNGTVSAASFTGGATSGFASLTTTALQAFNGPVSFPSASVGGGHAAWSLNLAGNDVGELALAIVPGSYSTDAAQGDIVLRAIGSGAKLLLQTGAGASAIAINNNYVGIGNPAPKAKLDVSGSGWFRGDGGSLALQAGQGVRVFEDSASATGQIFAYDYGNSAPLNLALQEPGGNVGIGINTPVSPLSFANATGDKICLYSQGAGVNYGIGIQAGLLQVHTGDGTSDISFGYGVSTGMTETMRIEGSGNVDVAAGLHVESANTGAHAQGAYLEWNKDGSSGQTYVLNQKGLGLGGIVFGEVLSNSITERMRVNSTGFVGIGTPSPAAPLDVESIQGGLSIKALGSVQALSFPTVSDRRIKDIVGPADTRKDLETIEALRVTDYRMKDRKSMGEAVRQGLIAQEVEAVIPEAVNQARGFIPNIYAYAGSLRYDSSGKTLRVTMRNAHELKKGDFVRVVADDAIVEQEIAEVPDEKTFVLADVSREPKRAFVFGKRVDDFRSVDYNRIFTAGVGAIQELARRMAALENRESRLGELEKKAARVDSLEHDVADLKKAVAQLAEPGNRAKQTAMTVPGAPALARASSQP